MSSNLFANASQGIIIQGNNNPTYTQQSSPIPIDTHHQRHQQHSPLHHQSYPNNQITAEKMMSYRNANAASPANLSSSQGSLSKVCQIDDNHSLATNERIKTQNSYRNSPHSRPSPGSSPGIPGLSGNFDSNSSAPCSPSPLTTGNNGCVIHRLITIAFNYWRNVSDNSTPSHPLTAFT